MVEQKKKFDPASLSEEEQDAVVERRLGVHPKYFVYQGISLTVDIYNLNLDHKHFNGFLPHLKQLGIK